MTDFKLNIHYKQGRLNTADDAISRLDIDKYMQNSTNLTSKDEMVTVSVVNPGVIFGGSSGIYNSYKDTTTHI